MTDEELKNTAEEYAGLYFDRQTEYKSFWHDVDTFKAVAEWMKKQMMEEAVEGEAHPDDCEIWVNLVGYGYDIKDGDKVRIIILKEEN